MMHWLNWKSFLVIVAIGIVIGTLFFTQHIAEKIALEEKQKVLLWVDAQKTLLNSTDSLSLNLAAKISAENDDIPIIETNEKDSLTKNYLNLDSFAVAQNPQYLQEKLVEFKQLHAPLELVLSDSPYIANKYYYGESMLQKEARYYPIIQLLVVAIFILVLALAQRQQFKSTQNQLWAGLAKETAHQLGTPITSLKGWLEVLQTEPANAATTPEIEKDINRLQLISERFGKIGSTPQLEEVDLLAQLNLMVDYIRKRASNKVLFSVETSVEGYVPAMVSPPLFDWVIENLLKNALDAMNGKGTILLAVKEDSSNLFIDVTDSGKGIPKNLVAKVFKPGFTTKKRGWGLGLTLTKRIVEQYHGGQIFIKWSEVDKGTCFTIILPKGAQS